VHRARIVESGECRVGSIGRPIVTVIGGIPAPGHSGPDSKSCMVQKGVGYRCAQHPTGRSGNGTRPLFEPCPIRQRNRPDERDRKNNPIPLHCTHMYTCLKNAQFVRINPTLWRARNAFQAAQLEPHSISSQEDPIRPVYIRATSKTWSDYPPRLSDDDFVPMFTYLQRNRSQHLCTPRERAGQPGTRAQNREWGQMDARRPLAARDDVCDAHGSPDDVA